MGFNFYKILDKIYSVASPYRRDVHYGRSQILRKVANFPYPLPINIILEHGVDAVQIDLFEKNSRPKGYLVFSAIKAEQLKQLGKNNVVHIPDPFTYVVNNDFKHYVPQVTFNDKSNRGNKLIFFYAHSTASVIDKRNSSEYLDIIKGYQRDYEVTVCLHYSDVKRGVGLLLSKNLIEWTAIPQHPRSEFAYKFFDLVNQFNFAASTLPGSYLYYCIFVGIPFELVKLQPKLENISDKAQAKDFIGYFNEYPNSTAYELFRRNCSKPPSITSRQTQFVFELLGYVGNNRNNATVVQKIKKSLWSSLLWKK